MKLPELLAPAGNYEKLKTAIHYGADAVYLGGKEYSLRAHAANFTLAGLDEATRYAHDHQVKVYVTVNIFAHNRDLTALPDYLQALAALKVDGLIISDPGIFSLARRTVPEIPIHISTQANVTNLLNAKFWQAQGAKRVNLARELSLAELTEIRQGTDLEMEVFVHGALCISYSGRCLLSQYLTGRNANQGDCAHPCRYNYVVEEEKRPGQFFPVEEDNRGTYIFNAKDLCLLKQLPRLVACGIDSLKIEGRMKSVYYVGAVVRAYRGALDYLAAEAGRLKEELPPRFMADLLKVGSRGYTENFFNGPPGASEMLYNGPQIQTEYVPVGIVRASGVEIRNPLRPGERIEYLRQGFEADFHEIVSLTNEKGVQLDQANPGSIVTIETSPAARDWQENGLLRKAVQSISK